MQIFTEKEIRQYVDIDLETMNVVEEAFASLRTKKVEMPPIMRIDVKEHNGELDVKSAYIPGLKYFAVKLSSGFFNNDELGLPSGNGLMLLLSSETGFPRAILLDNGYLTHVRTAAAGAVSAKLLAKENITTAGVIGTGAQARYQMIALQQVRPFKQLRVCGRNYRKVEQFKQDMEALLKVEVVPTTSIEEVVKKSEVVVTTTPSETPLIKGDWLHPGIHITAMGSDAEHKQELYPDVFLQADRIVCDVKSQCKRLGELHHAYDDGTISNQTSITELGEILTNEKSGRLSNQEITVCDLTGTGVQDTAIAIVAYEKLRKLAGITVGN
ncbi:cyclodeaminase [Salirhabdus salicampi]|uniref:cyclodeaminase n=1 Tax=Salirhabdus salicampi TaxID=476102 RepID=UPI0020C4B358|nr:cyclodeaminase [Salirhabdus salicampi]MCP8617327.1 cyclodeaminase [Salirhabdus salicampi]